MSSPLTSSEDCESLPDLLLWNNQLPSVSKPDCAESLSFPGLELLLGEVYDTVFSAPEPARAFAETSVYRILQRRFLGVQLATSGRFRCKWLPGDALYIR